MSSRPLSGVVEVPLFGAKAAGRLALVDEIDYPLVAPYRWQVWEVPEKHWGPYATARIGVGRKAPRRYMHQLLTGNPLTDHINHDGLDNRRENLRMATRRENLRNQRPIRAGTSQYKGVGRTGGRWRARIKIDGREINLGRFATEIEAACAYDNAAKSAFGVFACLNFPGEINAA